MTEKKKILAISGSTRKNSSNEAIIKFIAERYAEMSDVEIYQAINRLPHFNLDLDGENLPGSVKDFRRERDLARRTLTLTRFADAGRAVFCSGRRQACRLTFINFY